MSQDGFLLRKVEKVEEKNSTEEDNEDGILKAYRIMLASSADLTNILENSLLKQSKQMQKIMGFFSFDIT